MREAKPHILYVDDEPDNLTVFKSTFRRDYKIHLANSAHEGVEILKENPQIEAIITDQRMPEVTGVEFLESILPNYPNPIRMILTGFSDVEDIIDAINKGQVARYITKPWDKEELKKTIDQAIEVNRLREGGQATKAPSDTAPDESGAAQVFTKALQDLLGQPIPAFFDQAFSVYQAADASPRDSYWTGSLNDKKFLALIDSNQAGIEGSLLQALLHQFLEQMVAQEEIAAPEEILNRCHQYLLNTLQEAGLQSFVGVKMGLLQIDSAANTLYFASAQCPLVYFKAGQMLELPGDNLALGHFQTPPLAFSLKEISLADIQAFYVFSDGLPKLLKEDGAQKYEAVFHKIHPLDISEQSNQLKQSIQAWINMQPLEDDILVLAYKNA